MYSLGICKYCGGDKLRMINTAQNYYRVICLECVRNWKVSETSDGAKINYERNIRR